MPKLKVERITDERTTQWQGKTLTFCKFVGVNEKGLSHEYESSARIKQFVGQEVEGEISENKYGLKFKMTPMGGQPGFGSARPSGSPREAAAIAGAILMSSGNAYDSFAQAADMALNWIENKRIEQQPSPQTVYPSNNDVNLDEIPF